jgi:hypothetical protein
MAQQTQDVQREGWELPESGPNECHTVLQNTTIWTMSLAMKTSSGGNAGKAQPYVSNTANSQLLGFSVRQWAAPSGSDLVLAADEPAVFKRGIWSCPIKAGDVPTEALLNVPGGVFFDDSSGTVKATNAGTDCSGTLRALKGGRAWVEI